MFIQATKRLYQLIILFAILNELLIDVSVCASTLGLDFNFSNNLDIESLLSSSSLSENKEPLPDFVDWRNVTNRVTTVKNQKKCQAEWAFVTSGLLEGQLYQFGLSKEITSLSSQSLIDCSTKNDGCIGGSVEEAINFIKENGIQDDKSYPFRAAEQICRLDKSKTYFKNSTLKGYAYLPEGNVDKLKEVLARYGPVAARMDASDDNFAVLDYSTDVYYYEGCSKDKKSLNLPILVVGYGKHPKKGDYWIIKNSWGWAEWGTDGFLRISSTNNHCGIATVPLIAVF